VLPTTTGLTIPVKQKVEIVTGPSEVSVNSPGNPWSHPGGRKRRLQWKGFAEKEGFKSEMIE